MIQALDSIKYFAGLFAVAIAICPFSRSLAADSSPLQAISADLTTVPQNLLKLVHTPEVQKELQLEGDALTSFLEELTKIDGPWWRVRVKPEAEQRKIIASQEQLLIALLGKHVSTEKLERLKQIELQSQGTRINRVLHRRSNTKSPRQYRLTLQIQIAMACSAKQTY